VVVEELVDFDHVDLVLMVVVVIVVDVDAGGLVGLAAQGEVARAFERKLLVFVGLVGDGRRHRHLKDMI